MQDVSKSHKEEISKNNPIVAVVVIDIDISTADVNQCDASRKFYHSSDFIKDYQYMNRLKLVSTFYK